MPYTFHGTLRGLVCDQCPTPLFPATVRIYTFDGTPERDKEVFSILTAEEVTAKRARLVAETQTDDDGSFSVDVDDVSQQKQPAFEIDVRLDQAPGLPGPAAGAEPVQATISQIAPDDDGAIRIERTLASRLWCRILALLDAWVICGRVLNVTDGSGVGSLTVEAFDRDWLQDDALGSATTDGSGRFRIHYTSADFKTTPFSPLLNVELTGGPDVFFKVTDSGGVALIDEGPAAGRQPGRENVGNCFCVTLRVQVGPGQGETPPVFDPLFTHVGDFAIATDIDATSGLTSQAAPVGAPEAHGGPDFGFHRTLELRGLAPQSLASAPGDDVYYRFLFEDIDASAGETPVTGAMVATTVVGNRWIQWDQDNDGFAEWRPQPIHIRTTGATPGLPTPNPGTVPPIHVVVPNADGWIRVETGTSGGGYQILLQFATASTTGLTGGTPPNDGPGNPVSAAKQRNGTKIRLRYQVASSPTSGPPSGSVAHQSEAVLYINNWAEVRIMELVKQVAGGGGTTVDPCAPALMDTIDVRYTVDHQLLRDWDLAVRANNGWTSSGPGGPSAADPRGNAGTHTFALGAAAGGPAHCSHTVTLAARRRLTDGKTDDDRDGTRDTFCT